MVAGAVPVWRRVLNRLAPAAPAASAEPAEPLVSVVVPVYNVEEYLRECLDSVLAQDHRNLQVLVIDDGSTDSSAAIVAQYAEQDPRIEFHSQPNAGLGATRNRASTLVTGEFLVFLDSDDRLPKRAISALVEAAERTGADVTMGPLLRFNSTRRWRPVWASELHRAPEFHARLAERPELLRNHYACAKLYRTAFWRAEDARFREGVAYEDQPLVTRLLIAADGIAALADPVYEYRERDDQSSISQRTHTLADLQARAEAWRLGAELVATQPEPIRSAWLRTILGTHVHWYLDNDSIARPDYWNQLRDAVAGLDRLDASAGILPPGRALALDLLRADDRDGYLALRSRGAFDPERSRVVVAGDGFCWRPLLDEPAAGDPERSLDVAELDARVAFETARWSRSPAALHVEGRHTVRGLETDGLDVRHEIVVAGPGGTTAFPASAGAAPAAFAADLPWSALAALAPGPGRLAFSVRSRYGEATITAQLNRPARWFSARRLPAAVEDGLLLVPDLDAAAFSLVASLVPVWAERTEAAPGGVSIVLAGAAARALDLGGASVPVADGRAMLPIALLDRLVKATGADTVPISVGCADGRELPLSGRDAVAVPGGRAQLRPDAGGTLGLVVHQRYAELSGFRLEADRLDLDVSAFSAPGWSLDGVLLRSRATSAPAERAAEGHWVLDLAGLDEGGYDLIAEFADRDGVRAVRVAASPAYVETVPRTAPVGELVWRSLVAQDGAVHFDAHPEQ